MSVRRPPTGVILAGGASSRMGADKALIEVEGRPMAARVADALREAGCGPVFCQGGDNRLSAALGVEIAPDPEPGAGPVPAILAALRRAGGPIVVAACDLVDLDAESVRAVIVAGDQSGVPVVAVCSGDDRPHLLSFWPEDALAPLQAALDQGLGAYRRVLDRLGAVTVHVASSAVRNVNRPEDLASGR